MRFLLDECLSARLVEYLREAGHDAVHVKDRALLGAADPDVLSTARLDQRVLVSADTDFGELLALTDATSPSVILFRQGNRGAEHHAATLLANLEPIIDDLTAGAVVVLTDDRVRIRRLPVG